MRRLSSLSIPVVVAATALVLASAPLAAQDTHDHGAQAGAGHSCACCGNSSSGAMNHADGGCCGNMAGAKAATAAEDHSAHQGAQPAAKAEAKPMNQAGAGCCGGMNQAAAAKAAAGGSAGCCGNMAMNGAAKAEAKPMDHGAGGCCASMNHDAAAADGKPMAMGDPTMMSDMQVFHFLLDNRSDIHRTVTILPNGIDTLTESDKPEIAAKIKTHVAAMYARLKDGRPIHQRDPLFIELFEHADQIDANITYTDKGLRVVETSTDPAVAVLLHKHADMVNNFIKNGMPEMMKNHLEQ